MSELKALQRRIGAELRPALRRLWRSTGTEGWLDAYNAAKAVAWRSHGQVAQALANASGPRADEARSLMNQPEPSPAFAWTDLGRQRELNKYVGSMALRARRALALVIRPDSKDSAARILSDEAAIREADEPSLSSLASGIGSDVGQTFKTIAYLAAAAVVISMIRK